MGPYMYMVILFIIESFYGIPAKSGKASKLLKTYKLHVVLNEKGCQLKAGVQGFSPATVPCAQGFSVHIYPYTHAYMCN